MQSQVFELCGAQVIQFAVRLVVQTRFTEALAQSGKHRDHAVGGAVLAELYSLTNAIVFAS